MIIPINIPDNTIHLVVEISCIVLEETGPARVWDRLWFDREKLEEYRGGEDNE